MDTSALPFKVQRNLASMGAAGGSVADPATPGPLRISRFSAPRTYPVSFVGVFVLLIDGFDRYVANRRGHFSRSPRLSPLLVVEIVARLEAPFSTFREIKDEPANRSAEDA